MVGESEATLRYQQEAKQTLEEYIIPFLKEHGKEIGRKAVNDDILCKRIVDTYKMVYDFPEHISIGLLESMLKKYQEQEKIEWVKNDP